MPHNFHEAIEFTVAIVFCVGLCFLLYQLGRLIRWLYIGRALAAARAEIDEANEILKHEDPDSRRMPGTRELVGFAADLVYAASWDLSNKRKKVYAARAALVVVLEDHLANFREEDETSRRRRLRRRYISPLVRETIQRERAAAHPLD